MQAVIHAAFKRPGAIIFMIMIIFGVGLNAWINIPKQAEPDIDIPISYVSVSYSGISPTDAEKLLVKPLEKQLRSVAGLDKMTSAATEGYASVTLEFLAGEDIDLVLEDVRKAVDDAKSDLPPNADDPKITEISLSLFPILTAAIYGNVTEKLLILAARDLKDKLEAVDGVLEVEIGGDREEMVEVLIDAGAMESYGLNPALVIGLVAANNQLVTAGSIDTGAGRLALKVPGVIETIEDLMNLPIKIGDGTTIHFNDIATVRRGFVDADNRSRVNGESSLVLDIKKRVGANLIEVAEMTRKIIDTEIMLMSGDVKVNYLLDKSKNVRSTLSDLGNNVTAAVLIVMIVVVASLGLKNAALVALAIPGSFLIGIAFLYNMGITLNIVVLFSLILVAGMLVDGVIVTVEYADRRIAQSVDRATAYREGAVRMAWPIIASTVTTLMVFLPLLFWPGIVGSFMKFLPITVICVLSASLLMALVFIPVLGGIFGKKVMVGSATLHSAPRSYRWILKRAIRYPMLVVLFVVGFMVVAFGGYFSAGLGVTFFPDVEPEQAAIQVLARGDLAADERDDLLRQAESRVLDLEGVSAKYAKLGSDDSAPRDSIGSIRTVFDDWQKREKASILMDEMRRRLEGVTGIKVNIQAEEGGPGGGAPIHIEIFDNNLEQAAMTTDNVVRLMAEIGGFVDIKDTRPLPGIEWTIEFDRDAASRHGVSIDALGNMIKLLTEGVSISDYRPDDIDDELDIKLRFPGYQRNLDHLEDLRIPTASGDYVPMSVFAKLMPRPKGGDIERKNGKRFYSIDADVEEGLLPATQLETLQGALVDSPDISLSSSIVFGGESEDIEETSAFFAQAFSLSMCLMILVLMIQFNSVWQTFVTMSAIILSSGGVILGLWLMDRPFGVVMSGLGIIALAGVVVNNNIVLIDTFNEYRAKGYEAKNAAFHAGLARFRPVLLTAVTTIMGLLPMVFGLTIQFGNRSILSGAPSSQWWTDLSSTIAGGLTFATILTLLATPALLVLGANVDALKKRIKRRIFTRHASQSLIEDTG
ncbi:MAG: efflux RND transporter permease subunit [Paracoccaceae bacterium]|nr:efflux RND transporter permease subunit [Paracoccaceae bacterium]